MLQIPDWALPKGVFAFVTTRRSGQSVGDYSAFNLATHVGDADTAVARNRAMLKLLLERETGHNPINLQWLEQVHGTHASVIDGSVLEPPPKADAAYTIEQGVVLSVLTADCLPVLFASSDGSEIAVAHAGWRGLCNGVLEATAGNFRCEPAAIRCWLGPAIAPCHFEVGDDVRDAFLMLSRQSQMADTKDAFQPIRPGKWLANLYALARLRLAKVGITNVTGEPQCTVCKSDHYYSYRHQPVTGRFATGIVRY